MNIDRDLANAVRNLNAINSKAVPKASAMAINRIAKRAMSQSIKATSREVRVQQKILRRYAKINKKATAKQPVAYVRVRRNPIPAIHIGEARTQIKRKKGRLQVSAAQRDASGRYQRREISGQTSIKVGKHTFQNAFLQQLKNGKWHIMQRTSDNRYPIQVCSIPIKTPITTAFTVNSARLMNTDMPKELRSAVAQQIRVSIVREMRRGN